LAIGTNANSPESIAIAIEPPADFNFKKSREILALRRQQVEKYRQLLTKPYQPSEEVFGQLEDGKPWWGLLGLACFGPGNNSIR
jgi:hypothetical protein